LTKSIVISGPPAVGKTTVAKGLAKEFNLQYLSGGDVLKEMAKEQGFDSDGDDWWDTKEGLKFLNQREQNSEFDKNLDNIINSKLKILENNNKIDILEKGKWKIVREHTIDTS